jgi:hypothetical protein
MKIIDEFYLRNPSDRALTDKKLKSSKTLSNYESKTTAEFDPQQNQNGYIKKVLSKNPVFMINYFNVHTIKYLFISIFEKIDSSKNKKIIKNKNKNQNSIEQKYFVEDFNELMHDFQGKV